MERYGIDATARFYPEIYGFYFLFWSLRGLSHTIGSINKPIERDFKRGDVNNIRLLLLSLPLNTLPAYET